MGGEDMIGDIILAIRQWWKQLWCIHEYKPNSHLDFRTRQCVKCGKLENKF